MASICILRAYTPEETDGIRLADAYREGALKAGHALKDINIYDLNFDPFVYAYQQPGAMERDLEQVINAILRSDHVVIFVPVYKAHIPMMVHSFCSRIFYTDSFGQVSKEVWGQMPMFHLKTARIISSLDPESWQEFQKDRSARFHPLKKSVLELMGFQKVRTTTVPPFYKEKGEGAYFQKWMEKIFGLGEHGF